MVPSDEAPMPFALRDVAQVLVPDPKRDLAQVDAQHEPALGADAGLDGIERHAVGREVARERRAQR